MKVNFTKGLYGIKHRLQLIVGYFSRNRDFDLRFVDILSVILRPPCTSFALNRIESIFYGDEYLMVKLQNSSSVSVCLYWPKTMPIYNLYMVIAECMNKDDWHYYEIPETTVMPGDVVVDCGAAEGLFSLMVIKRAQQVILFEPLPLFVSSLKKTFHEMTNVVIVSKALGNTSGPAVLSTGTLNSSVGFHSSGVPIEMITLDQWMAESGLERIDYIKGDLEGFEMEVLQGAANTIRQYKPKIAFTTYHDGNNWREILAFCRSLVPDYTYCLKGISCAGPSVRPIMIHLWLDK